MRECCNLNLNLKGPYIIYLCGKCTTYLGRKHLPGFYICDGLQLESRVPHPRVNLPHKAPEWQEQAVRHSQQPILYFETSSPLPSSAIHRPGTGIVEIAKKTCCDLVQQSSVECAPQRLHGSDLQKFALSVTPNSEQHLNVPKYVLTR